MSSPPVQLEQLLTELFPQVWQLAAFLKSLPDGPKLVRELPGLQVPHSRYVSAAVDQLEAEGVADEVLFEALFLRFPHRQDYIQEVAESLQRSRQQSQGSRLADSSGNQAHRSLNVDGALRDLLLDVFSNVAECRDFLKYNLDEGAKVIRKLPDVTTRVPFESYCSAVVEQVRSRRLTLGLLLALREEFPRHSEDIEQFSSARAKCARARMRFRGASPKVHWQTLSV